MYIYIYMFCFSGELRLIQLSKKMVDYIYIYIPGKTTGTFVSQTWGMRQEILSS